MFIWSVSVASVTNYPALFRDLNTPLQWKWSSLKKRFTSAHVFRNRTSLTILRTTGDRTCNRSNPDLWTRASSAVVTDHISGKSLAQTEPGKCQTNIENLTLGNQKDNHLSVRHRLNSMLCIHICICGTPWGIEFGIARLPYICSGRECAFAFLLVYNCVWNGWNVYAATGFTWVPLTVKEKAWKHSIPHLFLMRLPPLWFTKHVPQISQEEKKTSSFITTDHTTHLRIHLDWQFISLQFMVIQIHWVYFLVS